MQTSGWTHKSDHLRITIWTVCAKDVICFTNLILPAHCRNLYRSTETVLEAHGLILYFIFYSSTTWIWTLPIGYTVDSLAAGFAGQVQVIFLWNKSAISEPCFDYCSPCVPVGVAGTLKNSQLLMVFSKHPRLYSNLEPSRLCLFDANI